MTHHGSNGGLPSALTKSTTTTTTNSSGGKKSVTFKDLIDSADEDFSKTKNTPSKMYESFVKGAYQPAQRQARRSQAELELAAMEPPRDYEVREIRPKPNRYYDDPDSYFKPSTATTATKTPEADDAKDTGSTVRRPAGAVRSTLSAPNILYGNRRYYSRYSDDPDYFDYDLNHSVDLFRKHKAAYVPLKSPRVWEQKLFKDMSHMHGDSVISSHMFTKKYDDNRDQHSSYLSAALRTPTYWAYRYQNLNYPTTSASSSTSSATSKH